MDQDQRTSAAARILDDKVFIEAWDLIRKEILIGWEHSSDQDIQTREELWLSLKLLSRLKSHFESIVTTGKMNKL
jgi:hypothetical protein